MLKGKKSQYDPPYPSRWSVGPGGQRDQEHGVVQHVQGEGYQPPETSRTGSSQVPKALRMIPLPIQVNRLTWGSSTCSGRRLSILIC